MSQPTQPPANASGYTVETLTQSPRLMLLHGFLNDEECAHLIAMAEEKIWPSTTVDPETGEHIRVEARSSSSTYFWLGQTEVIAGIEARIAHLLNLPVENGEGLQVLNYQIGQQYLPHFDFFDPAHKGSATVLACGGQRVATCIMYLSSVAEGGETHFPEVGQKISPVKGDAILFYNVLPDGEVDRQSLHASLPVIAGEKWVATKWTREREYKSPA
jgi:prolyl 4-hydroxylase